MTHIWKRERLPGGIAIFGLAAMSIVLWATIYGAAKFCWWAL